MQTKIIAITNEKGGTAKTTTAVSLSAALGEMGQQVLLVDLDGQAAASRWLGVEEDNRLAEALARGGGLVPVPNVLPGVSLVPASGRLDSVAHELRPTQGGQLRKVLHQLDGFDWIFIDCPPSLGNRLIANALLAASHVLVPVETSILALDGLKILLTTLQDIRDGFEHPLSLGGVLACRYDSRTKLSQLVLAELQRALPGKVFQTIIRENVRIRECPASGQSILAFAPESHAAEDYRALAREMIENPQRWIADPAATQVASDDEKARVGDLRRQASEAVRQTFARSEAAPSSPAAAEARITAGSPGAPAVGGETTSMERQTPASVLAESPVDASAPVDAAASSAVYAEHDVKPIANETAVHLACLNEAQKRLEKVAPIDAQPANLAVHAAVPPPAMGEVKRVGVSPTPPIRLSTDAGGESVRFLVDPEPASPQLVPVRINQPDESPKDVADNSMSKAKPAAPTGEQGDRYADLRAYLRRMQQEGKSFAEVQANEPKRKGLRGLWQKVFK